jgi:hypothetical protein
MESAELVTRLLPTGWTVEIDASYGAILCAMEKRGFVTVDERLRGFALGISVVRKRGIYFGRNWKTRLYLDAIAALNAAIL